MMTSRWLTFLEGHEAQRAYRHGEQPEYHLDYAISKMHGQLFTEDGGDGAKDIDFNDVMLTVRQYNAPG